MMSWFPVAFQLPAFRFSVIRCPPRSWALLTVGLPASITPDLDGVTAFRTFELRPGWVPPIPRGRRCSSRPRDVLGRRLPLFRGESFNPAPTFPSTRGSELRGISRRFRFFTRPACPSPVAPGWVGRPWASPRASHPAVTGGARRGRGQVVEHGPGTTRSHQPILQSGSSPVSCDRRRTVRSRRQLETAGHFRSGLFVSNELASTPGRHVLAVRAKQGRRPSRPRCACHSQSRSQRRPTALPVHACWGNGESMAAFTRVRKRGCGSRCTRISARTGRGRLSSVPR